MVSDSALVQFPDGAIGALNTYCDSSGYGDKYCLSAVSIFLANGPTQFACYYASGDCTGDCLVPNNTFMRRSIVSDGSNYFVYSGNEPTSSLTLGSSRSFGYGMNDTCSPSTGTRTVFKPSKTWTPPDGVTFPLNGLSFLPKD